MTCRKLIRLGGALAVSLSTFATVAAHADDGPVPPLMDPDARAECGACHMAYPPAFLPERSWRAIMAGLADHFGEDASLGPERRARVEAALVAEAGAAPRTELTERLDPGLTLLKISDLPKWRSEHRGIRFLRDGKDVPPADCAACHRDAARGLYDDD